MAQLSAANEGPGQEERHYAGREPALGAIEGALDAVVIIDVDDSVVYVNAAGERMLGFTREEVSGRPLSDLLVMTGPWLLDRRVETLARWRGRDEFPVELTMTRASDVPPLRAAFIRDLARVRPLASPPRMNRLLESAEELVQFGTWEFALETRVGTWSDQMYRIFGLEMTEVEPSMELLLEVTHPGDRERVEWLLETILQRPERCPADRTVEFRIIRRDGSIRELRTRWRVEFDGLGRAAQWLGVCQDVTNERLLERELLAHHAVEQAMHAWQTFDEGVIGLLRRLGAALDFPIGSLWLWNDRDQRLTSRALWFSPTVDIGDFKDAVDACAFRPGEGLAGHAWDRLAPVIIKDMRDDPACGNRAAAARVGLRGGIAFPAMCDDRPVAALTYYGFDTQVPTERFVRTLGGLGRELGRFLGRRGDELGSRRLSAREQEVLQLAAEGNSGPEIAALLSVSPATVKSHFESIYERLGVGDRAAAVAYALRIGLIR